MLALCVIEKILLEFSFEILGFRDFADIKTKPKIFVFYSSLKSSICFFLFLKTLFAMHPSYSIGAMHPSYSIGMKKINLQNWKVYVYKIG
jgi:hypothetical protein